MLQIAWCTLYASYSHMLYAHLVCYVVRAHMVPRACVGACATVRLSIVRLLRRGIAFIYAHSPAARVEALRMMVLYTFGGYAQRMFRLGFRYNRNNAPLFSARCASVCRRTIVPLRALRHADATVALWHTNSRTVSAAMLSVSQYSSHAAEQ